VVAALAQLHDLVGWGGGFAGQVGVESRVERAGLIARMPRTPAAPPTPAARDLTRLRSFIMPALPLPPSVASAVKFLVRIILYLGGAKFAA
jgi:hypothetical protein